MIIADATRNICHIFCVLEAIIAYGTQICLSGEGYICFVLHAPDILRSGAEIFWYFLITSAAWDQIFFVQEYKDGYFFSKKTNEIFDIWNFLKIYNKIGNLYFNQKIRCNEEKVAEKSYFCTNLLWKAIKSDI